MSDMMVNAWKIQLLNVSTMHATVHLVTVLLYMYKYFLVTFINEVGFVWDCANGLIWWFTSNQLITIYKVWCNLVMHTAKIDYPNTHNQFQFRHMLLSGLIPSGGWKFILKSRAHQACSVLSIKKQKCETFEVPPKHIDNLFFFNFFSLTVDHPWDFWTVRARKSETAVHSGVEVVCAQKILEMSY